MRIAKFLGAAAAAISILTGSPAAAQAPAGSGRWNVDWGEYYCTLLRQSERAPYPIFALRTIPGTWRWEVRLIGGAGASRFPASPRGLSIRLEPGGNLVGSEPRFEPTAAGRALTLTVPPAIPDLAAAAQSLTVSAGDRALIEIMLPQARQAVAALRQCVDDALREWGIDPAAIAALRTMPILNPALVVSDSDYPAAAIREGRQGATLVRMMLDATGRVTECVPVVSSGHVILDVRTCAVFRQRVRATPATGADGRPAPSAIVIRLRWILPN